MTRFKDFARKTQPLAWKPPALPVEAKRKTPFDVTKDLRPGDRVRCLVTNWTGTFTRYDGSYIYAHWDQDRGRELFTTRYDLE